MYSDLIEKDLNHIWHPCSYMQDFKKNPPLVVEHAKGSYITTNQGVMIDAISSWWCKSLGHGHPKVISAIRSQLDKFEHVITANTTHPQIVELAEKLAEISGKQHVFFASDGSSAVEIAMKLAIHSSRIKGRTEKTRFVSLKNSYHGETFATMSVSDLGIYKKPFENFGHECHFLDEIPYINSQEDPLWNSCTTIWPNILKKLEHIKHETCAIVVEPIIQAANGMRCYSADFLKRLRAFAKQNNIYLIADEIMTGLGRTGKWLASEHADISADMICLSKGLTSGSLPLSLVLIDHKIYKLFYKDYSPENAFLHSHTYSGNPLAISAALATINTMQTENINEQAEKLGHYMREQFTKVVKQTGKLTNMRSIGAVVAADLIGPSSMRIGYLVGEEAQKRGALLRPLGNTIYWVPPLNTDYKTIADLAEITFNSIEEVYKQIW
jgi:adenosylmethionine---8-amino-7-oxononanoate aminotransferase